MTTRARSFDTAAASYAAHRPGYPPALLDAVEELTGRPLAGARVADIGAGTGIATALLHRRGADVVAVEPGDGMAAQLRLAHPRIPVLRGDGNRLPSGGASPITPGSRGPGPCLAALSSVGDAPRRLPRPPSDPRPRTPLPDPA